MADDFAARVSAACVAQIAYIVGFDSTHSDALQAASGVMMHFIGEMGRGACASAEAQGRTDVNALDVVRRPETQGARLLLLMCTHAQRPCRSSVAPGLPWRRLARLKLRRGEGRDGETAGPPPRSRRDPEHVSAALQFAAMQTCGMACSDLYEFMDTELRGGDMLGSAIKNVPTFPVRQQAALPPAMANEAEAAAAHRHIPPHLPRFPDAHTCGAVATAC